MVRLYAQPNFNKKTQDANNAPVSKNATTAKTISSSVENLKTQITQIVRTTEQLKAPQKPPIPPKTDLVHQAFRQAQNLHSQSQSQSQLENSIKTPGSSTNKEIEGKLGAQHSTPPTFTDPVNELVDDPPPPVPKTPPPPPPPPALTSDKPIISIGGKSTKRVAAEVPPPMVKNFHSDSVGFEIELAGISVTMSANAQRTFAFVRTNDDKKDPLFMVTKDMITGTFKKGEAAYTENVLELVSYPCEATNTDAVMNRKNAILWFMEVLRNHTKNSGEGESKNLSDLISPDGKYAMIVTNNNHTFRGNTPNIPDGGYQATMAIKAEDFGNKTTKASIELENAHWYKDNKEKFGKIFNNTERNWDDVAKAKTAFIYLGAQMINTINLAGNYNIAIETWTPATPSKQDFSDPSIKNLWRIMPRSSANVMLNILSDKDQKKVRNLLKETLKDVELLKKTFPNKTLSEQEVNGYMSLAANVQDYLFSNKAILSGHSYPDVTITNDKNEKAAALLFEFRALSHFHDDLKNMMPFEETVAISTKSVLDIALEKIGQGNKRNLVQSIDLKINNMMKDNKNKEQFMLFMENKNGIKYDIGAFNPSKMPIVSKCNWLSEYHQEEWLNL